MPKDMNDLDSNLDLLDLDIPRSIASYYWRIESDETMDPETKRKMLANLKGTEQNDSLTMLPKKTSLEKRLNWEIERAKRYNRPLSVIMACIDNFQEYYNTYGQEQGDVVLRHVAGMLQLNIRKFDVVGRYEGENYLMILPETGENGAKKVAEKLRQMISESIIDRYVGAEDKRYIQYVEGRGFQKITASLGIVAFRPKTDSLESITDNARTAMSSAKNLGGNRIVVYSPPT